ncbi:hypothetical protein [Phytomonospora endophytica]|uniref:Uncharacterized protein n=1 Tax=Phytomonospora endophytica TaxID=714109 RepID=A0A841FTV1_9ACTN|nr:hypothetical protein [Phytomonospora endophytica]MBB6036972.1 hypothetical protein [Phytomonospora endophytica]GIG67997.1 hypothetical protein Pen01_42920 [Phytomonospora endophytica]
MFWVAGVQIDPGDLNLNGATTPRVRDAPIRAYDTWVEATAHAANTTDYIGNLPGPSSTGTWVRFHDAHMNVLGEDHTEVTFRQMRTAVNMGASFIFERFASDVMPPGSQLLAAYDVENAVELVHFGINAAPNRHLYGSESIYPKIGFGLVLMTEYLNGNNPVAHLCQAAGYTGQPVQRYLKIAWGLARDIADQVNALNLAGNPVPPLEAAVALVVANHTATLNPYITGLVVDAWLGDTLTLPANVARGPELLALANAMIPLLCARGLAQEPGLAGQAHGNFAQRLAFFGLWRDLNFAQSVAAANVRNIRYAGMGALHLQYLQANAGMPANSHGYDMRSVGAHLIGFENATALLRLNAH